PGMTVKIMGSGWFPGETVSISIHEEPQPGDPDFLTSADADAGGNIVNQAFSVNNGDIGRTFTVTATSQSGATKTATFTDGGPVCTPGPVNQPIETKQTIGTDSVTGGNGSFACEATSPNEWHFVISGVEDDNIDPTTSNTNCPASLALTWLGSC